MAERRERHDELTITDKITDPSGKEITEEIATTSDLADDDGDAIDRRHLSGWAPGWSG